MINNPFKTNKNIRVLEKLFNKNNKQLRLVGGSVRDILLGKEVSDYDFCTDALPSEMIAFETLPKWYEIFTNNTIKIVPTGIDFGTLTFIINGESFEVTTLRKEVGYTGRKPTVVFTDAWEEDSSRRDFTINGMMMDKYGKIYDWHNGEEHLKNGVMRFIGDSCERLKEDPLRAIRYFRLQQTVFPLKPKDWSEVPNITQFTDLSKISGERIKAEFKKCKTMGNLMSVVNSFPNAIKDQLGISIFPWKVLKYDWLSLSVNIPLFLLVTNASEEFAERIVITNSERYELECLTLLMNEPDWKKAVTRNPDMVKFIKLLYGVDFSFTPSVPFNISGTDLLMMGYTPSPRIREILFMLRNMWENSDYTMSREELLEVAKAHV